MTNHSTDVLAIGSCYLDTNLGDYPFDNTGILPETELAGRGYEIVPGGSAVNFCTLLHTLGPKTAFVGMAGEDVYGDMLAELLEKHGVEPVLIRRPDIFTNISFNMTNPDGKHIMLTAGTANASLGAEAVIPTLEETLPTAKMLYLGGCFKLKALMGDFPRIVDLAKRHSTKLVVDHGRIPDGISQESLRLVKDLVMGASYYFPSRDEFCALWNVQGIEDGLRLLHEEAPQVTVVVKDGENGAYYFADGAAQHVEAEKVDKVVNATGAGDSFNAGVMSALAGGLALGNAVEYGCRVAAAKIRAQTLPLI